jgi:hypothetical protein
MMIAICGSDILGQLRTRAMLQRWLEGALAQPLFPQNCVQVFISPLALKPNVLNKVSFPPHPQPT